MQLSDHLTHLPDVLQVAGSAGALTGALVATFVRARAAARLLDQAAVGAAVGGVGGVLFGFGLYIGAKLVAVLAIVNLHGA